MNENSECLIILVTELKYKIILPFVMFMLGSGKIIVVIISCTMKNNVVIEKDSSCKAFSDSMKSDRAFRVVFN